MRRGAGDLCKISSVGSTPTFSTTLLFRSSKVEHRADNSTTADRYHPKQPKCRRLAQRQSSALTWRRSGFRNSHFLPHMSPWRNWIAHPATNREAVGPNPTRDTKNA